MLPGIAAPRVHIFIRIAAIANSIGIELCSRIKNGKYYFQAGTVENAVQLVRMPDAEVWHRARLCGAPL